MDCLNKVPHSMGRLLAIIANVRLSFKKIVAIIVNVKQCKESLFIELKPNATVP